MNTRSQNFEFTIEGCQIDEVVASVFSTVMFHRMVGKFEYKPDGTYEAGAVGYCDVDCNFIDFTYVCCSSDDLNDIFKREISEFSEALRIDDSSDTGRISLNFFQKKRSKWLLGTDIIPWEVWTICVRLAKFRNEYERRVCREKVADQLSESVLYITEVMNRDEFVPSIPPKADLDLVFDTSFRDIQPYLFEITYNTDSQPNYTLGSMMKRLIKDNFYF